MITVDGFGRMVRSRNYTTEIVTLAGAKAMLATHPNGTDRIWIAYASSDQTVDSCWVDSFDTIPTTHATVGAALSQVSRNIEARNCPEVVA